MVKRDYYVDKLLSKSWNGKVEIITGIRRCGKSFLLSTLYKQALMERGVKLDWAISCLVNPYGDGKACERIAGALVGKEIERCAIGF